MKKNLKVLQEEISDCGVCSLLSIIRYYGGDANLEKLRVDSYTTNKGVTAFNLIECAKEYGFDAKGLKVNNLSELTCPFIAHIKINESLSHFVVVYKINDKIISVMDPSSGFKNIPKEEFMSCFTGVVICLAPKSIIKKNYSSKVLNSNLKNTFKRNWRSLLFVVLLNLLFIILSIVNSFYINFISAYNNYIKLIFAFGILVTIISFLNYYINVKNEKIKTFVGSVILKDFYKHIFNLPLKYVHLKDSGEIVKRVNDLESIKDVVVNSFIVFASNLIIMFSILIVIYYLTKPVFYIVVIFCFFYICLAVFLFRNITNYINELLTVSTEYNSKLQDSILGLTSIKNNRVNSLFLSNLGDIKDNDLKYLYDYNKYLNRTNSLLNYVFQILQLVLYSYMFINVKNGLFNYNNIIILSLLINMLYGSVGDIVSLIPGIYYIKTIVNKINDFYSMETSTDNSLIPDNYKIKVDNLSFSYNKFNDVLSNLSVRIKEGEKVIIKGESGKGKSTLCKILSGEYSNYTGSIYIGDCELRNADIKEIITYSSQNEYIFNGTIKDNILLGRQVSEEKFNKIVEICSLNRLIKSRPFKYDTYLYDGGKELSGGERNLIILARALVSDAKIYVLDETLAELNDSVENNVLNALFNNYKDKTIIYVSHKNKKNYFKRVIYV